MSVDVDEFKLSKKDAIKYLTIYVGESDWEINIDRLYARLSKNLGKDETIPMMRKILSCTILLPTYNKAIVPDVPENLLHQVQYWHQFGEKDWAKLMSEVVDRDHNIVTWRSQCQSLGVVYPIEFSPMTRQAHNWLFAEAEKAGVVNAQNKASISSAWERLVLVYGGMVICNIFEKQKFKLKKIYNWKTNYFFERLIFDVYKPEQVFKMKKQELEKTNPTLVRKIK